MPYDPNSPPNPLPPLNDGYPDDWHVPPSAQDDSFPDDWYVPPSAQPSGANPDFTASPPGSIAAYWSRLAADRQRTAPWAPPIFQDASDRFPPSQLAPTPFNLPLTPAYGLFGHPLRAPDWQQDSASGPFANMAGNAVAPPTPDFSASLLFGGTRSAPASTETPWLGAPRYGLLGSTGGLSSSFVSGQSDPSNVGAPSESLLRSPDASLPGTLQGYFSGLAQPAIGSIDDPAYLVPVVDKRKDPRNLDLFDERAFGNTPPLGSAAPRLIPPTGNPSPRPPAAEAQSPPAQAPSAPRASPPAAQAQSTLPGIPPPSGAPAGEPPGPAKAPDTRRRETSGGYLCSAAKI